MMPIVVRRPLAERGVWGSLPPGSNACRRPFPPRSPLTDWGTCFGGQGKRKHRVYLMTLLSVMVMMVPFIEHMLSARTLPVFHASSYLGFTMIL